MHYIAAKRSAVNVAKLAALALSAVIIILLSASTSRAVTVTSNAVVGNWNAGTTWVGGKAPADGDDVIIVPGATITVTANTHINSITFNPGATRTLSVNAAVILNVTGLSGITLQNAAGANSLATLTGSGTINCASILVGGTLTTLTSDQSTTLTSTISNLSVSGNLTIDGEDDNANQNDALFLLGTGTVTVAGTVTLTSEDDAVGGGSGDATLNLNSAAGTSGTLRLSNAAPFSLSGAGLETTDLDGATATVIYFGTGQVVRNTPYTNLTLSGSGTKTLAAGFTVENNVTVDPEVTLTIGGSTLTIDGGTLVVNGTVDFSNAGGAISETNNVTLTMGPNGLIKTVDDIGLGPGASASLQGTGWTTTSLETSGTVEYYRSSAQVVTDRNYNNLTITNAVNKTFTQTASRTVNGNLTINTGAPFRLDGAFALDVKQNWSNNGTFTHLAGSVVFNGTTNQTIGGSSANTFLTLTIANTGSSDEVVSLLSAALTTVSTALNVNDGVFDQGASSSLTTNTVTVAAGAIFRNLGVGDLTLTNTTTAVSNAGIIRFSANGSPCGDTDDILIRSDLAGSPRNWTGVGTFEISDVDVKDQAGTAIIAVQSGTNTPTNGANWTFVACASNTYTWSGGVLGSWIVAANWSPTRTLPANNDVLIINGTTTPAPTINNVPTEEIAALRLINGASPKLNAGAAGNTLTISGRTGTDLAVPSGNFLTLEGANALRLFIASGSTATVDGQIIFEDAAHRLLGNAVSSILFHSGADFTTEIGFSGNAFGSGGGAGNGVNSSVQFESGSQYFHNAGDSPFGLAGSGPVTVFQTESEVDWLENDVVADGIGFQASGRTYANLVIGNGVINVAVSDSGTGDFKFNNLFINGTGSGNSTLTFTGSGTSTVTIQGNITSGGTGPSTLQDVTLTAGSGGIQINAGGIITFGNIGNARGLFFQSDTTVATGTTLNLSRILQMGSSADRVVTDNGSIVPNFLAPGYVVGAVRKPSVPASYVFPVGMIAANGYTPVTLTNASGGGDMTVRPVPMNHSTVTDSLALDEYWTLTLNSGALTTDLQFNYRDADVDGSEGNYKVIRVEHGIPRYFASTTLVVGDNTAKVNGINHFSDWTLGEAASATAVTLGSFNAVGFSDGVQLSWDSGFEVNNLGYHLYREEKGQRTRVTPSVVAGSALTVGQGTRLTAGYSYSWFDPEGTPDSVYSLEAIDLDGSSQWAGPIYPTAGTSIRKGLRAPARERAMLLSEIGRDSADQNSSGVTTWPVAMKNAGTKTKSGLSNGMTAGSAQALPMQQTIAAGKAVKIHVRQRGWYQVTQAELIAAGFEPSSDARMLQLFVDGEEVPITLSTEGAQLGPKDTLEFYGVPLDTPTTDTRVYWLISGSTAGKRMLARRGKLKPAEEFSEPAPGSFDLTVERKEKRVYFPSLLNREEENIFGPSVRTAGIDQTLPIRNLDLESVTQPWIEVALQGLTAGGHQVQVKVNGTSVGTVTFADRQHPVATFPVNPALLLEGDNVVSLASMNGTSDISLTDRLRLTYPHKYRADGNMLLFSALGGEAVRINGFSNPNIRVIDVTNPNSPTPVSAIPNPSGNSYSVKVQPTGSGNRTLLAITDDQMAHPAAITANQPSDWNAATNGADMVIITHKDFQQAIEPLANLRRSQGLSVAVVDVEDVYDEFNYGAHTPGAIKNFLMSAANWSRKPTYLLLVGDSSWDPRRYLSGSENDFVPTKLIDTEAMETGSDDWFADFSGAGLANMAIGRLPAGNAAEANLMVSKILAYEQERALNPPPRGAVMVADRGFEEQSTQTFALLPFNMTVKAINRAEVGNDDIMRGQIVDALNQGPMIVNYYGHGSVRVWTGNGLLNSDLAANLTNNNRLSLFVMMTCLNGYASDANIDSLGEATLKAPNGGAVAVWASSGFTTPQPQFELNREFYRLLFGAEPIRLGDAVRRAKAATSDMDVRRTWVLLGDPAMRIR